jgi:hypothetical protein
MAKYYYCEGYNGWFVCYANNKREATKCLKYELDNVKEVRPATEEEVEEFCRLKGIDTCQSNGVIYGVTYGTLSIDEAKENNRRFQMRAE